MTKEWNQTTGDLDLGSEVTVYGELSGEAINEKAFWGTVTLAYGNDLYGVTDKNGMTHTIPRKDLRHRKRHSVAYGHVSDDKSHDRHAMEHFTNRELTRLEKYMCDNFPEDIPSGKLLRLHQHSDNASQHFKNTGAMNYFSTIINERGGPSLTAYVYTFGAPGHGKGPYDGIGGRWKQKIDKVIESSMTQ